MRYQLCIIETGIKEYGLVIEDNIEVTFLTRNNENQTLVSIDNDRDWRRFIHCWWFAGAGIRRAGGWIFGNNV